MDKTTHHLSASILILNWNGKDLLEECLPSVVDAVKADGGDHEIIVIDNGSTDDSAAFLEAHYPQVKIVRLDRNYSFIGGYNRGIQAAKNDIVVLLNNDMLVDPGFLRPLLDGFTDDRVFAVSSQIFFSDPTRRREETGKTRVHWSWGLPVYSHELPDEQDDRLGYTPAFWLGGGSAAVDRKKLLEIGGFDPLLSPLYMEDVDLSYQAWKRGWVVLFCPASKVIHKHRSTSGRLDRVYLERLIKRNRLLFIWKNITDPRMALEHLLTLPLLALRRSWGAGFRETVIVFGMALVKLPAVIRSRSANRRFARVSDTDIFLCANDPFYFKERYLPRRQVARGDRLNVLMVTPYFPSLRHGGGVRMYQMLRGLSRDHNVSLLSFIDNQLDLAYLPEIESYCRQVEIVERKTVLFRPLIPTFPPAITLDFGKPEFGEKLKAMLLEGDYDIVQCEFIQSAYQIPNLRHEVLILTDHEVQSAALSTQIQLENRWGEKLHLGMRRARLLYTQATLARKFDRIVTLTPQDAWEYQRYLPDLKVSIVPTGVDTRYYAPQSSDVDPHLLVYIGNFRHLPNVDAVLFLVNEVLPIVEKQVPDVMLCIIGADPTPEILALARPGQIEITGWVEDTRLLLSRASLAVFPIRLGVGLRNKILEACAMGKAVVTTPLGSAGLDVTHKENIWIADGAEEFAQGIISLLSNPAEIRRIGAGARQFIESQNSINTMTSLQEEVYAEVISERNMLDAEHSSTQGVYRTGLTWVLQQPVGRKLGYPTTLVAYLSIFFRLIPLYIHNIISVFKASNAKSHKA
jgi:O-antigen biosynthesis protein